MKTFLKGPEPSITTVAELRKFLAPRVVYRDQDGDYIFLNGNGAVSIAFSIPDFSHVFSELEELDLIGFDGRLIPVGSANEALTEEVALKIIEKERAATLAVGEDYPIFLPFLPRTKDALTTLSADVSRSSELSPLTGEAREKKLADFEESWSWLNRYLASVQDGAFVGPLEKVLSELSELAGVELSCIDPGTRARIEAVPDAGGKTWSKSWGSRVSRSKVDSPITEELEGASNV